MAISHLCLSCGLDLARTRAAVDHDLALPVVTCPACGFSCVRRRHPFVILWRQSNKLRTTLAVLFMQLFLSVLFIWSLAYLSRRLTDQMSHDHTSLWSTLQSAFAMETTASSLLFQRMTSPGDPVGPFGAAVWLSFSALAGLWLGSCFPHWRRWTPILLWPIALVFFTAADTVVWLLFKPMMTLLGSAAPYDAPAWLYWRTLAPVIAASVGLTVLFVPFGSPARRAYRVMLQHQSRNNRTRRRRARTQL